ncbi:hypothetical protein GGR54DRAFT_511811 [Hypoxylon sp. NC1633]|nr:hypothetical protein GGR54DRAFT_511811 [Hypoxylon sp. NC1633]
MAPPPPATPTPRRFLVPKRSQPRQETPKAFQTGGQQFQATPRFSLHSSSATPRGPAAAAAVGASLLHPASSFSSSIRTPAPARAGSGSGSRSGAGAFHRPTPRTTDPIHDIIDSSPPFAEQRLGDGGQGRDPIEIEVDVDAYVDADIDEDADVDLDIDAVPESSPVRDGGGSDTQTHHYGRESSSRSSSSSAGESDPDLRTRTPKRRRISISSDFGSDNIAFASMLRHDEHEGIAGQAVHDSEDVDVDMIQSSLPLPLPVPLPLPPSPPNNKTTEEPPAVPKPPVPPQQQPTFRKAPRFMPAEVPEAARHADPLPDAFSPHRKGAKYIPGGLAAEVRDWFVDVWAASGTTGAGIGPAGIGIGVGVGAREGDWIARIRVDDVCGAPGMAFIQGRRERDERGGAGDAAGAQDPGTARVVLAGSPRVAGLERRRDVGPGVVVGVGRPAWEVLVPGQGRWAVACEWAILS